MTYVYSMRAETRGQSMACSASPETRTPRDSDFSPLYRSMSDHENAYSLWTYE